MSSGDQSGPNGLNGTSTGAAAPAGPPTPVGVNGTNGTAPPSGQAIIMNGGATTPGGGGGSEAGGSGGLNAAADAGCSDGPSSILGVGPPSPLTGCYLLIIIGEPHSQDHKDIILQRLTKGFLSWDVSDCHVDLEEELHTITLQALEGEEGKHGERLIQYASENLVTEILIHPQINTFIQCIRNLLSSFTRHRHIIHTGYTFAGNGSWILQDGTFSVLDFMEAFQEHEVQRVLRAYPDTITMDLHCAPVGNWPAIQEKSFARLCRIRLNPVDVLSSGSERLNAFVEYLSSMIVPTEISELLESSDVVGNIRFSHPTLYVFPGGQGDAALFGINGFNMLVDGGFSRKSCFWDFVRHLDRLDAVLMTRINNTNIKGISAVVERKHEAHVYPQIGHFFCNVPDRKGLLSPDGDKDRDPLLVDLIEEGHQIVTNLKSLNLKAQNCYRDTEPINLYHKVGHGTLDMFVISPAKDSKEVKEFLAKWNAADPKLFSPKDSKDFSFPIQNIISICALLVWTPANPEDNITRILFPGSAPEYKILEGLEKMKNIEFMRHPVCSVKSIAPSLSTQVISKKSLKSSSIDKIIPEPILPSRLMKPSEKDNRILDNKLKMIDNKLVDSAKSSSDIMDSSADEAKMEKHLKSSVTAARVDTGKPRTVKTKSTESVKKAAADDKLIESSKKIDREEKKDSASDAGSEKDDTEKKVATEEDEKKSDDEKEKKEDEPKDDKKEESTPVGKDETKATKKVADRTGRPMTARSRIDSKPPRATKTIKKKDETNKSSPTTPKKTVEPKLTNGVTATDKKEDEPKKAIGGPPKTTKPVSTKPGKSSPKSTPAKSAKDANNRKVLEARQRPAPKAAPPKKEVTAATEKKESPPKVERKPISRRPKAAVPAAGVGGSPVKAKKVLKSEKDAVIRKAKLDKNGTTDSSLVSTPSADEAGVAVQKRIADTAASAGATPEATGDIDSIQQQQEQQLAELKEEQDAVREIEAVFKRDSEKAKRRELLAEHREVQDSTTEPEEEEEYLIIEKEEQYTEDSINEPESSATKEEEIQKHQRDSEESEKRKRGSLGGEKEEKADVAKIEGETAAVVEIIEGEKETGEEEPEDAQQDVKETVVEKEAVEDVKEETKEAAEKLSPKHKQDLEEEVQEIIASAKEIAKSKMETSMDGLKTEEMSSISPDEKMSSTKKTSDTRDENEEPEPAPKEHIEPPHESHHEERVSATAESGATTTAPTLPEDERIPLDEIKEDLVIEEKHVKEETKEVEVAPPLPTVYEPLERPTPAKMHFSAQQAHMRDVVKTPDEVADLPMHEEADFEEYSEDKDKEDEKERPETKEKPETSAVVAETAPKKETEAKQPEKTDKLATDKSAESDKLCDTVKDVQQEVEEVVEKVEKDTNVEKPPKVDTQVSPVKGKLDEAAILEDLESQIIPKHVAEVKKEVDAVTTAAKSPEPKAVESQPKDGDDDGDEEDKKSVHEEVIVATKVEPKIPAPPASVLDEIWSAPQKAEEKLDEIAHIIDDKAKETTSDLVAMKDEMVKQLVERKEEIVELAKTEISDTDRKLKESVADVGKEAEKLVAEAAEEVVKEVTAKADAISGELQTKAAQLDEQVAAGVVSLKSEAENAAAKADEVLSAIATEKKELEQLAKDIKEEVASKLDETKKQLEEEVNKTVEQAQEKAKSGISSFFGGITDGIKSGIEKIADKVETKIKDKTDQVETKLQQVTDKIEELKAKEAVEEPCEKKEVPKVPEPAASFEAPFGFERSFTQELRETHITTIDSPVGDADKVGDIKSAVSIPQHIDEDKELEELESKQLDGGTFVIEEVKYSTFEDANLRDIKEEEEEDRITPPQKDDSKKSSPKLEPLGAPPRARTPEDVAKIVANVAEVLKSDKDLEEIIPGFDPHELERKLSQGAPREEDVGTVQRMLVTASSEDGGEETVICPAGTITFSKTATPEPPHSGRTTPEIKVEETEEAPCADAKLEKPQLPEVKQEEKASPTSSGKSSPDLKTSPTSIEEKDKHELPEKVVLDAKKTPEKSAPDHKESYVDHLEHMDDSRRESAISTFSERDFTKDESSLVDERDSSRAHSISSHISDLKEDAEFPKDTDKADDKLEVFAEPLKMDVKKADEVSSPESVTSQQTEKSIAADQAGGKVEEAASEKTPSDKPAEVSRPESVASHVSEKAPSEKLSVDEAKTATSKEPSRPESAASHVSEKAPSEKLSTDEAKQAASKEPSRPESAASHVSEKAPSEKLSADESKLDASKEPSRPESAASHVSEKALSEKLPADETKLAASKEPSRPESAASHVSEKTPSEKSPADEAKTAASKEPSRPESAASHVSEKAPSDEIKLATSKEPSRPESAASHVSEKAPSEQSPADEAKTDASKEPSRPESAASHVSEKAPSEKLSADELKQAASKEPSRPESVASHVSEKAPSEKTPADEAKTAASKEPSRPESVASHVSEKTPSEKLSLDETQQAASKEPSRPESAASHVSEKAPSETPLSDESKLTATKELSRPVSAASGVSEKAASEKSPSAEVVPAASKEPSRPESVASHADEKVSEKTPADVSKEPSRPESAASHVSEKDTQAKDPSKPESVAGKDAEPDSGKVSRPESVMSHVSEKAASEKTELTPVSKESSRPESAADGKDAQSSETKLDAKEPSRPESAASHVSEKAPSDKVEEKQPTLSEKKDDTKESSRPESVASAISDKAEVKTSESKPVEAVPSRPESAASHTSEKAPSEGKPDFEKDQKNKDDDLLAKVEEKSPVESKDASRPISAASDKPPSDSLQEPKETSRPLSAASDSKDAEPQAKSRPESVASHVSEKTELKQDDREASRPESAASHVSEPKQDQEPAKQPESKPETKESSRPESAASHVSEKAPSDKAVDKEPSRPESVISEKAASSSDKSPLAEKTSEQEASRPDSVASHVSEKATSEKSLPSSGKEELKAPSKEPSRPESQASHVSDTAAVDKVQVAEGAAQDKSPSIGAKEPSRPASVVSDKSPVADAQAVGEKADEKSAGVLEMAEDKAASRPGSVLSDDKAPSEKAVEASSRPASVASHVSDKDAPKMEPKTDGSADKTPSRPESAASAKSEDKAGASKEDAKEVSRPDSVASHASEAEKKLEEKQQSRPESSASASPSDKSAGAKDASRPESAASHASSRAQPAAPGSEKSGEGDYSRPESPVAEEAGGDFSRPESPASVSNEKVTPAANVPGSTSPCVEKDLARPDSAASYHGEPIPDEKSFSRPDSPASCADDKEAHDGKKSPEATPKVGSPSEALKESKTPEEGKSDGKASPSESAASPKEFSRPDSPASCGDGSEVPSKEPESTVPEKDLARPDSAASYHGEQISDEKHFSRPDSPASCAEEEAAQSKGPSPSESKEPSRPESAAGRDKAPSEKSSGKEQSRPESAASHAGSDKEKSPVKDEPSTTKEELKVDEKILSRPESAASHTSEKSATSDKSSKRQEESASGRESAASDHEEHVEEKIIFKESRSKSLSAAMTSSTQKTGFDGGALGVLEEGVATSRDDLHVLKTPRESITKIEGLVLKEKKEQKSESRIGKSLFGPDQFPADDRKETSSFPVSAADHESPEQPDAIVPGVDILLKDTAASMKEIEKMSTSVITMIKTSEKKEESSKVEEGKSSTLSFPLLDSGKSTPLSAEKDKSQASSIKSTSPHEKDSLEESSTSLNTFIEKDSLSESTTKQQVTITKTSIVDESSSKITAAAATKSEAPELLGGTKTPPTAPISPNVVREDFSLAQHIESTAATHSSTSTAVTSVTTSSQAVVVKQHKDDVSGISTPKESVPSGKSSPGLMSVHTGSTDSASKSLNLGHSSGIETSESSPKPTSPFPKVVDTLKTDDVKTSSGMSTPDMTRTSTPDMVDSQIERIPDDKKAEALKTVTTTTTTKTTQYIVKDGEKIEVDSSVKTEVSSDTKKDDISSAGESLSTSSVTTTTTTKVLKDAAKAPTNLTLASTEDRSLTEEYDDKEALSPRSDISSGQASRIVAGWHDEDIPGSPMSVTSQAPHSPSTKYTYDYDLQHSSSGVSKKSDIEIDDSQDEIPPQYGSEEVKSAISIAPTYKPDPMSTSFYGQLPDISDSSAITTTTTTTAAAVTKSVPIPIAAGKGHAKTYLEYTSSGDSSVDSSHHPKMSSERKYLDEADLDFEKAFTKPDKVDLMTTSMHFSSEKEFMAATTTATATTTVADTSKKELDFTASGLPSTAVSQQAQSTSSSTAPQSSSSSSSQPKPADPAKDTLASWGKPLGLPSPAPLNDEQHNMKTTPKKERRMIISKTKLNNEKNLRKRSESPIKGSKKPAPVYVDLSYVPHHGNSYYANVEFFKRVRARYYVFSGTEPSREVYNALLEAKQTWEDKDLEVTIIPTYDTDVLGYWVSENEDLLAKYHIDLSPSAARCTINLQDHETSCSAYRLEF